MDWKDVPSFSITMLHCEVLRVLMQRRKERCSNGQRREWRSTPVYINGSKDPRVEGIRLCKQTLIDIVETSPSGATSNSPEGILPRDCLTPSSYFDLMSLGCEELEGLSSSSSGQSNLGSAPRLEDGSSESNFDLKVPHMLVSIALDEDQALPNAEACRRWICRFPGLAKHVKVEGVYSSYSTVLILSIPVAVYNMLPEHPACQPVAFVTSRNRFTDANPEQAMPMIQHEAQHKSFTAEEDSTQIKLRRHLESFAQEHIRSMSQVMPVSGVPLPSIAEAEANKFSEVKIVKLNDEFELLTPEKFFHRRTPANANEILRLLRILGAFASSQIISEFSDKLLHAHAIANKDWMPSCRKKDGSWDPEAFRDVLIKLQDLSVLIECQVEEDEVVIQISAEVLSWAHSTASSMLKRECGIEGSVILGAYLLSLRSKNVEISTRDKKHIQQCIDGLLHNGMVTAAPTFVDAKSPFSASQQIVWYLDAQGDYKRAAELCQIELASIIDTYGEHHQDALTAMSNLSFYLRRGRQYEKAEHYCRKALEGKSQVLSKNHTETLRSMRQLANLLYEQGKFAEAEPIAKEAMTRFKPSVMDGDSEVLYLTALVGSILRRQRKFDEALPIYEEISALSAPILGSHHPDTLTYYNNYAFLLRTQGRLSEAETIYRTIETAKQTLHGEHHPETLASMSNVAAVCQAQGKFTEAEHIYRKALEIRQKTMGKEHPQTLVNANNLAVVLQLQDKPKEVELLYRETVAVQERVLGKDHPDTMASMRNLVSFLSNTKRSSKYKAAAVEAAERKKAEE